MPLEILQAKILINRFHHIDTNKPVQMAAMNDVFSPFEGKINPGDTMGIKLYLQVTREIEKQTDNIDISVSNTKDIIDNFLSISNKYGWERLAFMVGTATVSNNIFKLVEHIQFANIQKQAHGYFVLPGIENIGIAYLP